VIARTSFTHRSMAGLIAMGEGSLGSS